MSSVKVKDRPIHSPDIIMSKPMHATQDTTYNMLYLIRNKYLNFQISVDININKCAVNLLQN